jgi:hypothetical protein
MWRHPKYYKELRKRNKSDQAISLKTRDGECERTPDSGLKRQATGKTTLSKLIRKLNKENAPPGGW